MKRSLSTRILIPNLCIVIGSLVMLAAVMLLLVRLFLLQEAKKEFNTARATVETIIKARKLNTLEDAQAQAQAQSIVRVSSFLFDAKLIILTQEMTYPAGTAERPLPESALARVRKDGGVTALDAGGKSYFAAAIPFQIAGAGYNMVIFTSLEKVAGLIGRLVLVMLGALFGAALIAALASIVVSKRIAGPLGKLSRWAHSIGGREFTRYEEQSGTAEIDFLAESLNGMAQRLKDYDAAQKTFLQNASHELRTPLMSIQGYAEGIRHGVFADAGSATDVIISESLRLSALVDDLLFLTRLETAEDFYAFAPVPLREVLSQCAEKLEGAAIKEGKRLTLLPCPDVTVHADGEKLLRALMNLAGNCLRYAKTEASIGATVSGGLAAITVRDDGPGFDAADMGKLFTRFYKGKQGKFGLGLSIAKAIVEKHGGKISAANGKNGGAEFTVELPCLK